MVKSTLWGPVLLEISPYGCWHHETKQPGGAVFFSPNPFYSQSWNKESGEDALHPDAAAAVSAVGNKPPSQSTNFNPIHESFPWSVCNITCGLILALNTTAEDGAEDMELDSDLFIFIVFYQARLNTISPGAGLLVGFYACKPLVCLAVICWWAFSFVLPEQI